MKTFAIQALWVAGFVALSAPPALSADPTEEMVALMESELNQYAEVSGKVAVCSPGWSHRIEDLAQRIAAWRYPGWWDGISGTKSDYAEHISGVAYSYYLSTVADPCPGLPAQYQALARTQERQIESATGPRE